MKKQIFKALLMTIANIILVCLIMSLVTFYTNRQDLYSFLEWCGIIKYVETIQEYEYDVFEGLGDPVIIRQKEGHYEFNF